MKFEEALIELRNGKEIFLKHITKKVEMSISKGFNVNLSLDDILYGEWVILEEPGKTFPEVFKSLMAGKKVRRKSWPSQAWTHSCYPELPELSDVIAKDWEILE